MFVNAVGREQGTLLPGWDVEHETKNWTGVSRPPMPSAVAGFATVSVRELPSFESDDDPNHNPPPRIEMCPMIETRRPSEAIWRYMLPADSREQTAYSARSPLGLQHGTHTLHCHC